MEGGVDLRVEGSTFPSPSALHAYRGRGEHGGRGGLLRARRALREGPPLDLAGLDPTCHAADLSKNNTMFGVKQEKGEQYSDKAEEPEEECVGSSTIKPSIQRRVAREVASKPKHMKGTAAAAKAATEAGTEAKQKMLQRCEESK